MSLKFSVEEEEALMSALRHHGFPHVMTIIDHIIDTIKAELLSIPVPEDPEKAALKLYSKRMQAEGAVALRNVLARKISEIKNREANK